MLLILQGGDGDAGGSDDAHHLLAALTTGPVLVFGGSLGALLGLDLVAHYSEQVRTLGAHEPPRRSSCPTPSEPRPCNARWIWKRHIEVKAFAGAIMKMMASTLMDLTGA